MTVALILAISAAPVLAAVIRGTSGNDLIRGTPKADVLYGLGGNDSLFGLRGNDRLVGGDGADKLHGGAGDDRLIGGKGHDILECGPGNDRATVDELDDVLADCEVVTDVTQAPPEPVSPPVPATPPPAPTIVPVAAGSYRGATNTGDHVFFEVRGDRTISRFRANDMREFCDDNSIVYGPLDVGPYPVPIDRDGAFTVEYDSNGTVGGVPAKFHVRVAGRLNGSVGSGTARLSSEFEWDGRHVRCATELKTWTASLLS